MSSSDYTSLRRYKQLFRPNNHHQCSQQCQPQCNSHFHPHINSQYHTNCCSHSDSHSDTTNNMNSNPACHTHSNQSQTIYIPNPPPPMYIPQPCNQHINVPQSCVDSHNKINYYVTPTNDCGVHLHENMTNVNEVFVMQNEHNQYFNSNTSAIATSVNKYLLSPVKNGSVTLTVDANAGFKNGYSVVCSNINNSKNYFEGIIYSYNRNTGEITINKIQNIQGVFNEAAVYSVAIFAGNEEVNRMKNKLDDLYQILFNVDSKNAENYNILLHQYFTHISNLYLYFFRIDLLEEDDELVITEEYLMKKVDFLFYEFFDKTNVDLYGERKNQFMNLFNPNFQRKQYSLREKIGYLYSYFFDFDIFKDMIVIY